MEIIECVVCGNYQKSQGTLICASFHSAHVKCLEKTMKLGRFKELFESCQDCLNQFLVAADICKPKMCLWCKKQKISNVLPYCRFTEKICLQCRRLNLFYMHCNTCDVCTKQYCEECKQEKRVKLLSDQLKCQYHSLCLEHLISKTSCQDCLKFKSGMQIKCILCRDPVELSEVSCASGHFYCKSCLDHFGWSNMSCQDCETLFKLPSPSSKPSPKVSLNDSISLAYPHTRCFECRKTGIFKVYKTRYCQSCFYCPKCLNNTTKNTLSNNEEMCKIYFGQQAIKHKKGLFCVICKEIPEGTSRFCRKSHFLCISCRNFLTSIEKIVFAQFLDCEFCVKEMKNLREYLKVFRNCNKLAPVVVPEYQFQCPHRWSFFELKESLCFWVSDVLKQFSSNDPNDLNEILPLRCSAEDCDLIIPLDSEPVVSILTQYFDESQLNLLKTYISSAQMIRINSRL